MMRAVDSRRFRSRVGDRLPQRVNIPGMTPAMNDADALARGRSSYARRDWADAYQALSEAEKQASLGREDLSRLSWAAALIGRDSDMLAVLERLYQAEVGA